MRETDKVTEKIISRNETIEKMRSYYRSGLLREIRYQIKRSTLFRLRKILSLTLNEEQVKEMFGFAAKHHNLEKKRLKTVLRRLRNNPKIITLTNEYKPVDVEKLAFYLTFQDIINYKHPTHFIHLENIIKIILGYEANITIEKDYQGFKKISQLNLYFNELIDINSLANHTNKISKNKYTFLSQDDIDILKDIISITLSKPPVIITNPKPWQEKIFDELKLNEREILKIIHLNKKQ